MAAKRDLSGIFDAELKSARKHKAAVLDNVSHLSHKGMTFLTEKFIPEWTEIGVEMQVPGKGKDQQVSCRGVVVQCTKQESGKGFEVSLLFLDLPKNAENHFSVNPAVAPAMSISLAR